MRYVVYERGYLTGFCEAMEDGIVVSETDDLEEAVAEAECYADDAVGACIYDSEERRFVDRQF